VQTAGGDAAGAATAAGMRGGSDSDLCD